MARMLNIAAQRKLFEIVDNEDTLYTRKFAYLSKGTDSGLGWFTRLKTFAELARECGITSTPVRIWLAEERPEISKMIRADRGKRYKVYPHELTSDEARRLPIYYS